MAKKNYEFFYQGTPYSLEPGYGNFIGYRMSPGDLGAPTSVQTANQITEVSNLLNQGIKTVELQPLSPEVFDQIPKQHFKEIKRLKKLTGTETTLHGPLIEPSGFTKDGWSEVNRESSERHLKEVVQKAHEMSPDGNMPITLHSSGIPGTEFMPTKDGKVISQMIAVNRDTGQLVPLKREKEAFPEYTGGKKELAYREAEDRLRSINATEWENKITNLAFYKKEADEILTKASAAITPIANKIEKGEITQEEAEKYSQALEKIQRARLFLDDVATRFRNMYSDAYKYSDDTNREKLKQIGKAWKEYSDSLSGEVKKRGGAIDPGLLAKDTLDKSRLLDKTLSTLGSGLVHAPEVYVPVEDFAKEKASQTFAGAAFEGYKKYGDKAPIISIENLYPGMAISNADDLKDLINKTKEQFMIKATQQGYSKQAAKDAAEKLIGATWDVGHLNMMKKEGFKDKDIVAETKKIAPYVKHVHLTDNFGYSDSHLPPGMGNVPVKGILQELEKKGYKGKAITEAGGFVQHFKTSPHPYVLEALGSPLYTMQMAPYWNQISNTFSGYFSGYGPFLPEQSFSMYGSGFSTLPMELGGQMPGKQSRFSGTPTQ